MNIYGRMAWYAAAAALACGCHSSSDDGDDAARPLLAAFNAAVDMPSITFLREEEVWSALDFGAGTEFRSVDADQYDLSFDALLPGDETTSCVGDADKDEQKDDNECTRLLSTSVNVIGDHEYVVALLGSSGNLRVKVYDKEVHEFDTSDDDGDADDDAEVQFFHLSDTLPQMDVYLEPPGTVLSPVQAKGTLASGEEFHAIVEAREYVLVLTPVADPSRPFFTSESLALEEHSRVAFAIRDGAGEGTSSIKVSRFRDQGGTLLDRRARTELRMAHIAPRTGNVDVFADEEYLQPFFPNQPLELASAYKEVPSTSLSDFELDVTPAGNPGIFLAREELSLTKGERATFFLIGPPSRLDGLKLQDGFRKLATHGRVRFVNSASLSLEFYVVPRASNINTLSPTLTLSSGASSESLAFDPGSYDFVMTRSGTDTVVFGPIPIELAGGGIYTIAAMATGDATTADAALLDDFAN